MQLIHPVRLLCGILISIAVIGCAHAPQAPILSEAPPDLLAPVVLAAISADGDMRTQLLNSDAAEGSTADAFRIASVTKTFSAATLLRLAEQGRVDLDASISHYIDPELNTLLVNDGYATDDITIKQVLSHTAGFNDHAQDPKFIAIWMDDPQAHRERRDYIRYLVKWLDPVGEPGEKFSYSDSGYLLLGDMIERVTGKPLPVAVREQLDFDRLGLEYTWWEQFEAPLAPRAHQHFGEDIDTHDWDASFDLYGGGGLVATTQDMARFFHALFAGKVFKKPETLKFMLSAEGIPEDSPYRHGIFEFSLEGRPIYWHGGFWGSYVAHDPATGRTFAASAYHQGDYRALLKMSRSHFSAKATAMETGKP